MKFKNIVRVEQRKLAKKSLTLVMLTILFIPVFYTYSIVTDAPLLQMTPSGALDFAFGQWGLLGVTGIFQVMFSLIVVGFLSSEVDKGLVKMAVMRQCERKKIIFAKALVLVCFMLFCYIAYIGVCVLLYYGIIVHTDYGTGELVSQAVKSLGLGRFIMSGMFTLLDTLITMGIVFLFSLRFKAGICFMLAIGTTTLFLIMQFFPFVQFLVPAYVGSQLDYGKITITAAGVFILLYLIVALLCIEMTARKFERMELK